MNLSELNLKYSSLKKDIKNHLKSFQNKTENEMYKEFVFCLLTPQSNARSCWEAADLIFKNNPKTEKEISTILKGRARFHNTKAKRVLLAESTWVDVKDAIKKGKDTLQTRNNIANIVNGYGLKEASHFMRNIGISNSKIAILDRHIIRNLFSLGAIKESDKLDKKSYLKMEEEALKFSKEVKIPMDELDLLFWHKEHEEFFK